MAGYDPVIATFEATTAPAIEAVQRYAEVLTELEATFGRVAEASGVLDERLAVTERGFQTAAVESNMLSSELSGLEERLGGAGGGAKSLAQGMSSIGKSGDAAAKGMLSAGDEVTAFAARFSAVEEELSMFAGRVDGIGSSLVKMTTTFTDSTAALSRALATINTEIMATAAALQEVAAGVDSYATRLGAAQASTAKMTTSQAAAKTSLKEVGNALLMVGGALGIADFAMLKTAGTFQANLTRLQTEAGLTDQRINEFAGSMQGLQDKILAAGNATGTSGVEMSNALYEPISAGLSLSQALDAVKYSAEEAKISGASLEDTTTAVTATMKAFGPAAGVPEQAVASLNAIVGQGMMRFQDFNQAFKNWGPTAATFGVSLTSAGAALAFMTDRGESAQSAGTKLAQVMAMMVGQTTQAGKLMGALGLSETDVATSNEAMAGAMATAHVTTSQLADDLRKPDGLAVALTDLKSHLQGAGLSADAAESVLVRAFGGGRQFKGLAELISNTGQLQQKFDQITNDSNIDHFQEQWDKVTQTFSFQWDRMVASVKNFGIAVGSNLMPAGASMVSIFGDIFGALSRNKDIIGAVSAAFGVLAVALPVASLGVFITKLGETAKNVIGVSASLGLLAAGFEYGIANADSFSGKLSLVVTSVLALVQGIKYLGEGSAFANWLSNTGSGLSAWTTRIGEAEGAMGKLKAGAGGVGELLTGPWGLAIGAGIVALTAFISTAGSGTQVVDELTDAIKKDAGELGKNSEEWVKNTLQQDGALSAANRLGISLSLVTMAAMGNKGAMTEINGVLQGTTVSTTTASAATKNMGNTSSSTSKDMDKLKTALQTVSGQVITTSSAYTQQEKAASASRRAMTDSTLAALNATSSSNGLTQSSLQVSDALSDVQNAASELKNSLDLLNGGDVDAEKANLSFKTTLDTLKNSIQKGSDAINDNTDAGRANLKNILDGVSAAQTHAEAVAKQTGSVQEGTAAFEKDVAALQDVWRKAGLTEDQIKTLTDTYLKVPHNLNTDIAVTDKASAKIQTIRQGLDGIVSKTITVGVNVQSATNYVAKAVGGEISKFAGGGKVPSVLHRDFGGPVFGAGTESSDSIPAVLSDNEYVIRARAASTVGTGVLNALNQGDLDSVYRMLGQRSDVHTGSTASAADVAGMLGSGAQAPTVVVVNITPQGSIFAENDLRQVVQDVVLKYAGRNSSSGWTPRYT